LAKQPVAIPVAQKFLKMKHFFEEIGADFDKRRNTILAEKGEPVEDNKYRLDPDALDEFNKEIGKIAEEEIQIPLDLCVPMADLVEVKMSADDLEVIGFMIEGYE
jgi:hypothetical protein